MKGLCAVVFSLFCLQFVCAQELKPINLNELPKEVRAEIDQEFKKYQLISLSEKRKTGKTVYKVELQKKNKVVYLTYSDKWDLINTLKTKSFTYDKPEQLEKRENLDEVATPPI